MSIQHLKLYFREWWGGKADRPPKEVVKTPRKKVEQDYIPLLRDRMVEQYYIPLLRDRNGKRAE